MSTAEEEEEDPNVFFLFAETMLFIDCGMINSTIDKGPFFSVRGESEWKIQWMNDTILHVKDT